MAEEEKVVAQGVVSAEHRVVEVKAEVERVEVVMVGAEAEAVKEVSLDRLEVVYLVPEMEVAAMAGEWAAVKVERVVVAMGEAAMGAVTVEAVMVGGLAAVWVVGLALVQEAKAVVATWEAGSGSKP